MVSSDEGVIGTSRWSYDNDDGSVEAYEADSGPPHELVDYQNESITVNTNDVIELFLRQSLTHTQS